MKQSLAIVCMGHQEDLRMASMLIKPNVLRHVWPASTTVEPIRSNERIWRVIAASVPQEPVERPFAEAGCKIDVCRQQLEGHMTSSLQQHLLMVMKDCNTTKQKN